MYKYELWLISAISINAYQCSFCSIYLGFWRFFEWQYPGIAEAASRPARAVLLQSTQAGTEGKVAFCAGGDVKSVAQAVREDPSSCFPRLQLAHEYLGVAALSRKREDGVPVICFMDAWHSNLLAVPRLYNSMELADLNS